MALHNYPKPTLIQKTTEIYMEQKINFKKKALNILYRQLYTIKQYLMQQFGVSQTNPL